VSHQTSQSLFATVLDPDLIFTSILLLAAYQSLVKRYVQEDFVVTKALA
jgi:hypothetical protein